MWALRCARPFDAAQGERVNGRLKGGEGDGRSDAIKQEDDDTCTDVKGPPQRMFQAGGYPAVSPHMSEETCQVRGSLCVGGIRPVATLDRCGGRHIDSTPRCTGRDSPVVAGYGVAQGHDGRGGTEAPGRAKAPVGMIAIGGNRPRGHEGSREHCNAVLQGIA